MSASGCRGFFITGTDTGVGKTLVTCALLHAFSQQRYRAVGMKPIAAGAAWKHGELRNDDVERIREAGNIDAPRPLINVYCFEPAIAPHLAARAAGVGITCAPIERAYRALADRADIVFVEGVGGFQVPLNDHEDTADLAVLLGLPLVLVVGMRLGCLNHALLTTAAIKARGLGLAGWIANHIDPAMAFAAENTAALEQRLGAPCIARIPFERDPDALRMAQHLRTKALFAGP